MKHLANHKLAILLAFSVFVFFSFTMKTASLNESNVIKFFKTLETAQQEKLYLHLDKPYYAAGDSIWFKAYLVNSTTHVINMPSNFIYVELINQKDSTVFRSKIKRIDEVFQGNIPLPPNFPAGQYMIRSYTNWMRNAGEDFFYIRKLLIGNSIEKNSQSPILTEKQIKQKEKATLAASEFSLTFFPEGGNMLTNINQQIAFKCQQADGFGKEITGVIVTTEGDTVTTFKTEHDGMGSVSIFSEIGKQLVAKVDGTDKSFDLPTPQTRGLSISMVQIKNILNYQIKSSPEYVWPDSLFLIAHTRGYPILLAPLTKENRSGSLNLSTFGGGITHFLVANSNGQPISQRLLFVYPDHQPTCKLTYDKKEYAKREKVTLQIELENPLAKGEFSISITDNKTVKPDSLANNILSNLLLTSDLKGHIESPGYYFMARDRRRTRNLDLLMLTHGWSRFPVENLQKEPNVKPEFFLEKGQFISGRVDNFIGKGAKEANIIAIDPKHNIIRDITTNDKGEFLVDGIDYQDSTTFVIQARTKKGLALVTIGLDQETIPERKIQIPYKDMPDSDINADYLFNTREKFYYEGGVRVYELGEVVIDGKHSEKKQEAARRVWADYSYSPEMLKKSLSRTGDDLLRNAYPNRPADAPLVVIDKMCYWEDNYILGTIYTEDIETFDLYKDQSRCEFGSPGKPGPAIVITLKPEAMDRQRRGIAWLKTLGYSQTGEFYSPVYDTPEKKTSNIPDLRTTIYWNPALIFDSEGKATVEFFTSDSPSSFNVEIEGVTTKGEIYSVRE